MITAEPASVEQCPPHISLVQECEKGATVAMGHCKQFIIDDEKCAWSSFFLTNRLELFFHRKASVNAMVCRGSRTKKETPLFFRFVCDNADELQKRVEGFRLPLREEEVLWSDHSNTSSPMTLDAPAATVGGGKVSDDRVDFEATMRSETNSVASLPGENRGEPLNVAALLPTVSVLVRSGPRRDTFMLVLRPCVATVRKKLVLVYHASLRRMNEGTRTVILAPHGEAVFALSDRFVRALPSNLDVGSIENPRNGPEGSPMLISVGSYYPINEEEAIPSLPQRLTLLMKPSGAHLTSEERRSLRHALHTRFLWGACRLCLREMIDDGDFLHFDGTVARNIELLLLSERGQTFVFSLDSAIRSGRELQLTFASTARSICCAPSVSDAEAFEESQSSVLATAFRRRWNHSAVYLEKLAEYSSSPRRTRERREKAPGATGTLSIHRRRKCPAISISPNSRLFLAREPLSNRCYLIPLPTAGADFSAATTTPITLPLGAVIHDAQYIWHPSFSGFLLLGQEQSREHPVDVLAQRRRGGRTAAFAPTEVNIRLWFAPFCGGACLPVHVRSYHGWRLAPAQFLTASTVLSLAALSVSADMMGQTRHYIAIRSSTMPEKLLTVYLSLPSAEMWMRTAVLSQPFTKSMSASTVQSVRSFLELHLFASYDALPGIPITADTAAPSDAVRLLEESLPQGDPDIQGLLLEISLQQIYSDFVSSESITTSAHSGRQYNTPVTSVMVHQMVKSLCRSLQASSYCMDEDCSCSREMLLDVVASVFDGFHRASKALGIAHNLTSIRLYLGYLHFCISGMKELIEALAAHGAATAIHRCVSFFIPTSKDRRESELWHALFSPLFDAAYAATVSCPSLAADILPYCSSQVRSTVILAHQLLRSPDGGQAQALCSSVAAQLLTGVQRPIFIQNQAEVTTLARRVFLQYGPQKAVEVLMALRTRADGITTEVVDALIPPYSDLANRLSGLKVK